jgi:hypothetical protein
MHGLASMFSKGGGRTGAIVDHGDEERSGDPEHVGGLLGGQVGVNGHDRDGVSVRHLDEDVQEQLERFRRYGDRDLLAGAFGLNADRPW